MSTIDQEQDQNQPQDEPLQLTGDQLSEVHGLAQQLQAANDPRAQRIWDFIQGQTEGGDVNEGPQFTLSQSPLKMTSWLEDLEDDLWGKEESGDDETSAGVTSDDDSAMDEEGDSASDEASVGNEVAIAESPSQQQSQPGIFGEDASSQPSSASPHLQFANLRARYAANQPQLMGQLQPVAQAKQQQVGPRNIEDVAKGQVNSTDYEFDKSKGHYKAGVDKCNLGVADWIEQSGRPRPQVKYTDRRAWLGLTRDPSTHEWADPKVQVPGWSAPMALSEAQPGDVIAQAHGEHGGHVGIVIAPNQTISVNSKTHPAGIVTNTDWGFRPRLPYGPDGLGGNGESPNDPDVVVRRYIGDQKKVPFGGGGGGAW